MFYCGTFQKPAKAGEVSRPLRLLSELPSYRSALRNKFIYSGLQYLSFMLVWADNKYSIVACNRPDHFWPVFVVDSSRHRLGASSGGYQHQQIDRLSCFQTKTFENFLDSRQCSNFSLFCTVKYISRWPFGQTQFVY